METHYSLYQSVVIVFGFLIGVSVPSSWHPQHQRISRQIVFIVWLLGSAVLFFSYVSQLLSQLVLVAFERPIDTTEDVLERGIPLMLTTGGSTLELFNNTHNPTMKEVLRKNVIENNLVVRFASPEFMRFITQDFRIGEGNVYFEVM